MMCVGLHTMVIASSSESVHADRLGRLHSHHKKHWWRESLYKFVRFYMVKVRCKTRLRFSSLADMPVVQMLRNVNWC